MNKLQVENLLWRVFKYTLIWTMVVLFVQLYLHGALVEMDINLLAWKESTWKQVLVIAIMTGNSLIVGLTTSVVVAIDRALYKREETHSDC